MTDPVPRPPFTSRDPLHGVTLEMIVRRLHERHGWAEMGRRVPIRCFLFDPSVTSSLKFLRRTPWARRKVEAWYAAEVMIDRDRAASGETSGCAGS
jgi:uncharacterized protein (DUF2132 family)